MKSRKTKIIISVLALSAVLAANLALAQNPNPKVLPPASQPYGLSYAEWSVKWWQWMFSLPADNSPILGTGPVSAGQSGPVWFLTGAFASGVYTRECTIPAGVALFFPVYNAWADNTGCPDWTTFSAEELAGMAQWFIDNAPPGGVTSTIDGVPVQGIANAAESPYRVGPQVFSYTLASANNFLAYGLGPLWGADLSCIADGTVVSPAAEDGVYLMVAPLSAGKHTIRFAVVDFIDVTYHITVVK